MVNHNDKVVIRDGTGIWKPATVIGVASDGFLAKFVRNAGPDTITVKYNSTIAWRLADAPVPA